MNQFTLRTKLLCNRIGVWLQSKKYLHTARFAHDYELAPLMSNTLDPTGLLVGVGPYNQFLQVKKTKERPQLRNIMVVARTGGGKSILAIPQILSWKHSIIVNDIKGELSEATAGYRATMSDVFFIDPRGKGHQYNPMRGKTSDLDSKSFAKSLLYRPNEGEGESFTDRAVHILDALSKAAVIEHIVPLVYIAQLTREPFSVVMERINRVSPKLAVQILNSTLADAELKDNKFLRDTWSLLTSRISPLLADSVVQSFAGSDFTMKDLLCGERPVTVYLRWKESDLFVLSPLVKLLWSSFFSELKDTYDERKGVNCRPVLAMLDEAANTGVPSLAYHASTVCGRGISIWSAWQDLAQIEGTYGRNDAKSLSNNCDTKIFYSPNDIETAEYISRELGKKSEYAESKTSREGKETSQGQSEQGVPLLSPQEIKYDMKDEDIFAFCRGIRPIQAKRMDWRNYPDLVKRTKIPMPEIPVLPPLAPLPQGATEKKKEVSPETDPDEDEKLIDPDAGVQEYRYIRGKYLVRKD